MAAQKSAWTEINEDETKVICNRAITDYVAYNAIDNTSNDVSVINDIATATDKVNTQDKTHRAPPDEPQVEQFHVEDNTYKP